MSHIADLQTIQVLSDGYSVRAVAWLSDSQPYSTGPVSDDFMEVLSRQIEQAWQPIIAGGWHECELCAKGFWRNPFCANANLFVPSETILYFAPAMIEHYILRHDYQPPSEFVDALLACPTQQSGEYFSAMQPFAERWHVVSNGLWRLRTSHDQAVE